MSTSNWNDLRVFLAVVRERNTRRAARRLGVDHSTVSRRMARLEGELGTRLVERRAQGYETTPAGEELLDLVMRFEEEAETVERRLLSQDAQLRGEIRVSMPPILGLGLLAPAMAEFARDYPEIDLDGVLSYELANLSKREADVAIRVTNHPAEHLECQRVADFAAATYAAKEYLHRVDPLRDPMRAQWIGWDESAPYPSTLKSGRFATIPIRHRFPDAMLQLEATKCGLGLAALPCLLGDVHPELERLSDSQVVAGVWIVRHPDLRATARVRAFVEFIGDALEGHRDLAEGRRRKFSPSGGRTRSSS